MVNADHERTVVVRSGAGDHLVRYTTALRQLPEISIGRHAVIGGFAVMVRLATAHRVTDDLDAVTWTEDGTPAALVAMKLRAMQQRRANVLNKRASDAYDAYRLLAAHDRDGSIARELATPPDGLGAWCLTRAREVFDTDASQTRRWLAAGSPEMAGVSIDELRTVGTLFADVLKDLLRD